MSLLPRCRIQKTAAPSTTGAHHGTSDYLSGFRSEADCEHSGPSYSLPYLFTLSVYAFPLFLGFLLLFARWRGPPAPEHIDESQIATALHDLETTKRSLLGEIAALKTSGFKAGIRYLKGEDRFEMRSRRGQELNQALTNARSSLADVVARIEKAQHPQCRSEHAWRLSMRDWRSGRAYRLALIAAFLSFAASATILEVYVYQGISSDLLVWNSFPGFIGRNIEVATIFGWALGLATLSVVRRSNRVIDERENGTLEHYADDLNGSESDDHDESDQEVDDPYLILNVSPQATISPRAAGGAHARRPRWRGQDRPAASRRSAVLPRTRGGCAPDGVIIARINPAVTSFLYALQTIRLQVPVQAWRVECHVAFQDPGLGGSPVGGCGVRPQ
jgi:hypothetical protein